MKCPKCQEEKFATDKPCPQCGFQGDADRLEELGYLLWLLKQVDTWGELGIDAEPVSRLKRIHTSRLKDTQFALGLRLPSFTPAEAEQAWVELTHLEALFEKVDEWRNAGYFKADMEAQDPVKTQRSHADELRQRLEEYQRPEMPQTDQSLLKLTGFLLDNIDLLASRQWFKSKAEIEKAIAPIMAMMINMVSSDKPE